MINAQPQLADGRAGGCRHKTFVRSGACVALTKVAMWDKPRDADSKETFSPH
jgi:hypothetical protein